MNRAKCLVLVWSALALVSQAATPPGQAVYTDGLENDWQDWSWASTARSTATVHNGAAALSVQAGAWQAAYFHHSALDAASFGTLDFWIHGGPAGGQKLLVQGLINGAAAQTGTNLPVLAPNTWKALSIPLTALGLPAGASFDGFWIQDRSGSAQPAFYLDDVRLTGATTPQPPPTNVLSVVRVDRLGDRHPIDPLIYGTAFASAEQLRDLNATLNRSGGNAESRYDWQLNAHNHGADWYFESLADSPATAGAATDSFIADTQSGGGQAMVTIPMIGWAPKLGPNRGRLSSYSIAKYGAQKDADRQWFPDAGNGLRANDGKAITWNDPNDANRPVGVDYQKEWMDHLLSRWRPAAAGGVRWFCMDNEPSIWHSSHRDVQPIGATMGELRDKFFAYAQMVKSADPTALVAAPEEWGWSGYFYSGYDQQAGAANGWTRFPDRGTNGGWDYLPWFLDQVRQRETVTGQRLLDVFTVHYYPQGGEFSSSTTTSMQQRRNRSTRSLWDATYVDESWINDQVQLIPRLKRWVAQFHPGTRIGLTEYNWGAEEHINGATAQADLLGIFGREGLDLATRWTTPTTGTPAYHAIKMFRNYDGKRSAFGETAVHVDGLNPDELSAFAAERSTDSSLTVMLVHKRLEAQARLTIQLTNCSPGAVAQPWQLTSANRIERLPELPVAGQSLTLTVPAQSITLLIIPLQSHPTPRLSWHRLPDPTQLAFQLEAEVGQTCVLLQSADLIEWTPLFGGEAKTNSFTFSLSTQEGTGVFLRAVAR